ncbi:sensor domain-containing diguanylate cyclase [Caldisericum exile]|uniref:diguanylate cyclase n=1 Tax=Caldisericum exile (strain DSM 21853 / NBRC 104410 / AZM16c01) TaxID=511051 RepID=A0A7U6JEI8_CALEA|nr:sensor domain-containing diguanylate cyclase [Caldisericum exile]BAL80493.1 hypothetical protein CSE_03670 [Caldisericum exile AZM16c01]
MTKSYSRFYRVIAVVSSIAVILVLMYIFVHALVNGDQTLAKENHILEAFIVAILFFAFEEFSLKRIEILENNYYQLVSENRIKDELIKMNNFDNLIKTFRNYFESKYNTSFFVFIKTGNQITSILSDYPKENLIKEINNPIRTVKVKLDDSECIFILKGDSKEQIINLKYELTKLWDTIENKFILEKNKKDLEKQKEYIERLNNLVEFSSRISGTLVLEETYMWIIKASNALFNADSVSLLNTSKGKGQYKFIGSRNVDLKELSEIENSINSPYFGEHIDAIIRTGRINYIPNTDEFPGWAITTYSPKSWIGIPLFDLEESVFIIINVGKNVPYYFSEEDIKFAEIFKKNINIALTKNLLLERYRMDSITDPLTKLYNRREFESRLAYEITQSQRYGTKFALLLMDLDKFKSLNDTFGHPVGDTLLKEFADVVRNSIRASDIPFRIGGDEFAVILTHTDKSKAKEIARRIKNNLSKINLGVTFKPGVSIGIKEYNNEGRNEFITECDKLLYIEKLKKNEG